MIVSLIWVYDPSVLRVARTPPLLQGEEILVQHKISPPERGRLQLRQQVRNSEGG